MTMYASDRDTEVDELDRPWSPAEMDVIYKVWRQARIVSTVLWAFLGLAVTVVILVLFDAP